MPGKPRDAIQQQGVAFCALPGLEARPSQREGDVAAASLSNVSAFNNTSPTRGASDSIDKSVSTDNSLAHDSGQHQFSPNQFHNGVKMMLRVLLMVCVGIMLSQCAIAQKKDRKSDKSDNPKLNRPDIHKLRPQFPTDQLITKSEQAIQDGFEFLVKTQNKDGSWGSHDPKMALLIDFGFKTKNRGSQDAVRTACTAICAEALMFQKKLTAPQQKALDAAIEELLKVRKFAYHPGESFNTWGYGYKLGFLVQLKASALAPKYEDRIQDAAQSCIDGLLKYQQHTGGWGYYAGVMKDFESMSFNTAFIGLSLNRGKQLGLSSIPEGMIIDATENVRRQRAPDGTFVYSSSHENRGSSVLQNLGAGSRTVSSALALYELGIYEREDLTRAMEVFAVGENYLESGRKLIRPHSAVHAISGYFFFFGYNYATEVAEILGDDYPLKRWDRLAWTMLRTQEKNGCWWDTAAADYGDKWGTGFAIMSLQRYVREMERRKIGKFSDNPKTDDKADKQDQDNEASDAANDKKDK